jgi:thiamine-monophosphate kinase
VPELTVADLGERALIERISRRAGVKSDWVAVGIGDDAAVIEPARSQLDVVTTDILVEDVHFRRRWSPPASIGHKALAVNLSDLAAMGASPRACLLSLALPERLPVADFDALVDGFLALARATACPLVGGNISRSPGPLIADVTAIGAAGRRRILLRSSARAGDELFVTGRVGGARAGLALLERGLDRARATAAELACLERYERPSPRLRVGRSVARQAAATAAIDLSDGLAEGVRQLAQASGLGAVVELGSVPIDQGVAAVAGEASTAGPAFALAGGEDYELLFAAAPRRRRALLACASRAGIELTRIGRLTRETDLLVSEDGVVAPLSKPAFGHFAADPSQGKTVSRS